MSLAELAASPDAWAALGVLAAMETVLGIDNIVFISILTSRLPADQQLPARRIGLAVALIARLVLLAGISWVVQLTDPLFEFIVPWSGKNLILFGGGVFLLYKATKEIYEQVETPGGHGHGHGEGGTTAGEAPSMGAMMGQIVLIDLVFSLDSVITAVGMVDHIAIMVAAVLISVGIMLAFAGPIGDFVTKHPSVKVLALSFLMLIGVMLVIEGTGGHVAKGYIYSAMGFSLFVEMLNHRRRKRSLARRVLEMGDEAAPAA